jgi:Ca-activated chloride channel family protein
MRNLVLIAFLLCAAAVWADGMLLPVRPEQPAFSVPYHRVHVTIDKGIATTTVDQAFHNNGSREAEGTYIFPIADGMTISKFTMYADNEALEHRILAKEEARRIYNGIVAQRKDPALLEWLGHRMIQARVFPIPAHGDKRVALTYQEVLPASNSMVKYVYPLKTEKLSARPLDECAVTIRLTAPRPLRSIYSPTHDVTIVRDGAYKATVTWKATHVVPDEDLALYYTMSDEKVGVDVLTYRDPAKGDGFFLLLAAPNPDVRREDVQAKNVAFVLDTSGSMSGRKIEQAKAALNFCVENLDARDRFTVIAFSSDVRSWMVGLQEASRANKDLAKEFIRQQRADGGTNINEALHTARQRLNSANTERLPVCIFLTDGQATVGVTQTETILANMRDQNPRKIRLFNFGVGDDYNAHLLDKLAEQNGGYAENVLPREDIEVKVSDFYGKISAPLLTNLALDWGKANVHDQYPKALPDLFKGSQLVVAGRYAPGAGVVNVTLTGTVGGKSQRFTYAVTLPDTAISDEAVPRLWATRKIGYLEEQLRLHGHNAELLEELVGLSKEYGILSQYTSFLVDVDAKTPMAMPNGVRRLNVQNKPKASASLGRAKVDSMRSVEAGSSAVAQSVNGKKGMNAMQAARSSGNVVMNDAYDYVQMGQLRNVGQRSFAQNGRAWVDVNFDAQRVVKVKAFSPAYFQLANAHPRMAQYLSVGDTVTVALKTTAIQVDAAGQEQEFVATELKTLTKEMTDEFGTPQARASAFPLAQVPVTPARNPWLLAAAGVLALPVIIAFRWRRRMRAAQMK